MDFETTQLVLANRSFLYALVARGFAEEADAEFAEILTSEHALEEFCLVESEATTSILALRDELAEFLQTDGAVQAAGREYVRIFVGPTTLRAAPWETVQLTGKRALFQPGVLDVRDAYREAGFLPVRYREVPDDFVGMEFDFMAKLAARAQSEYENGDPAWRDTLGKSRSFLDEHLLKWIDLLADSIEAEYGGAFYASFTRLAALVAKRDAHVIGSL